MEFMLVNLRMDADKGMVYLNGIMAKYFKENGKMELKMVSENGNLRKVIHMKGSGFKIVNTEKEYLNIVQVLIMVSLRTF